MTNLVVFVQIILADFWCDADYWEWIHSFFISYFIFYPIAHTEYRSYWRPLTLLKLSSLLLLLLLLKCSNWFIQYCFRSLFFRYFFNSLKCYVFRSPSMYLFVMATLFMLGVRLLFALGQQFYVISMFCFLSFFVIVVFP